MTDKKLGYTFRQAFHASPAYMEANDIDGSLLIFEFKTPGKEVHDKNGLLMVPFVADEDMPAELLIERLRRLADTMERAISIHPDEDENSD